MRTVLYLGIEKPEYDENINLIHYPIIKTVARQKEECADFLSHFSEYTHLIFTSKTSVNIFFEYLGDFNALSEKNYIAVGKATAKVLLKHGIKDVVIAQNETAEGVVELLKTLPLRDSFLAWPHSALSRNVLTNFFVQENLRFSECVFYDTVSFLPEVAPDFNGIDEIVFTSSSTVDAFFSFFQVPTTAKLTAIGPITKGKLEEKFCFPYSSGS